MRTLNLGILAHVDAGKTTLTERLLHNSGVIDELGSVDDGNTQTDTLALERARGITIKAAVVSFVAGDVAVNLIDTPGHPDFIAEVERVLGVLDGAVLVVSAVEGVQAQTRVLMRALRRLAIPTLIFVNKTDRRGADPARVLRELRERLSPAAVGWDDERRLAEVLADHDDAILEAYVADDVRLSAAQLRAALVEQTRAARVHPVFTGSARSGAGVSDLVAGVTELLPAAEGDAGGPPSGSVFKIERGPAGEKVAYVRMFSGALRTRDRLPAGKVTAISVFEDGAFVRRETVAAGQIGKLWGLAGVRIGDAIGEAHGANGRAFSPPTLETVVVPGAGTDRRALRVALDQLAEQDPLIDVRQDGGELSLSLYGEVQKEVIQATLADDFGVAVVVPRVDHDLHRAAARRGRGVRADRGGLQPAARHRRPARGARPARERDRVPAGSRARLDAAGVLQGGRGDAAGGAEPRQPRLARARLRGDDDALGLLRAAEPLARDVRQVDVEHGAATSGS